MATQVFSAGECTREELDAAFQRFSNYQFPPDVTRAQSYINAGVAILGLPLTEVDHSGERVRIETLRIRESIDQAQRWLASRTVNLPLPVSYAPACDWRY